MLKAIFFLWFARKFGGKYGKNFNGYCDKCMNRCCKTTSKRAVRKTAEVPGDLIGNKIADRTTSVGKRKIYQTTRKKTANYWWFKIVLIAYKNGIPKSYKSIRYNIW